MTIPTKNEMFAEFANCKNIDERIEYILQNIKDDKNNVVEDEEEEFAGFKDKDFI